MDLRVGTGGRQGGPEPLSKVPLKKGIDLGGLELRKEVSGLPGGVSQGAGVGFVLDWLLCVDYGVGRSAVSGRRGVALTMSKTWTDFRLSLAHMWQPPMANTEVSAVRAALSHGSAGFPPLPDLGPPCAPRVTFCCHLHDSVFNLLNSCGFLFFFFWFF